MESSEELQQLELTALKSIYAEDFIETPPPKAWKGASRLPEFTIRVPHPDAAHATRICFNLHVILPKSYPTKASPTFTIQKPIIGISHDQITILHQAIQNEAKNCRGAEMIFQIVTFSQDWLSSHVVPPIDVPGSLANQMTQRALEEERIRKEKERAAAEKDSERAAKLARELDAAIRADAQKQQLEKEKQYRARKRANSEATEVPIGGDTPTESFSELIEVNGTLFNTVKIFHPRPECLGTIYMADPICDDVNTTLPLQLYVVAFDSHYYTTSQGAKKLKQVESEIQRLIAVRHPNLLSVFAVKLTFPHASGPPRLAVLYEAPPALNLRDVLEDCDSLKEERASEYLVQILSGLNAIHARDLVHRGITGQCIGITQRGPGQTKMIKLGKVGFYTRLLDLHRSNSFGANVSPIPDDPPIPDAWLSKDVKNESSLLYTRHRDIHAVGIVVMQMLLGIDVTQRYSDPYAAAHASSASSTLQRHALTMLFPAKKNHVSCLTLLADLAETSLSTALSVTKSPVISTFDLKTPMPRNFGSPEMDFFPGPHKARQASRWKEDWEELELLGKGAFGSVVKARNKIDSRIYAIKKIRLSTMQSDTKIFREVNALSRLSHRFIVRYFTTWVETAEAASAAASDESGTESGTEDGMTSVPDSKSSERRFFSGGRITFDLGDLDDIGSGSRSSFPSIHFSRSSSPRTDDGEGNETDSDMDLSIEEESPETPPTPPPVLSRTLYIQMEFVERQTLKERIDEGLSEEEAWRLFQQILDALVHMSTLGILHRDIKLTNIFIGTRPTPNINRSLTMFISIDAKGDCKVGDFGLATSSLASVEPPHTSHHVAVTDSEMTLEVGTRLYIAPEVQSRKRGPRNHTKADMYSLGIVFFEMNFTFSTGSERIAVIEGLREPLIVFPTGWNQNLTRQRQIITWLLQHDPDNRPTALELSQSSLLPARLEDEYFKGALQMMANPDSPHHQAVLSSMFNQPPRPARGFLYDMEADLPEHAALNDIVQERLASIFRLRGAVDMEPPLLMPLINPEEKSQATFLDRYGDIVTLPTTLLVPFARLAARGNISRIKRYHIADVYRSNAVAGHPKAQKAAVFDIITTDISSGPIAAGAEILAVANDCLDSFPDLSQHYEIHISHSTIVHNVLDRIPSAQRSVIVEIISQSKSSPSQKRALLLKKGLLRSTADELEALAEPDEDVDAPFSKLEKVSPTFAALLRPVADEVKKTIQYAVFAGVSRPILFHPLMLGSHHAHFKDGVLVEVVRKNKRMDVLAAGGRYDNLIAQHSPPKLKPEPICAVGLQIAVEKITLALAAYQVSSVMKLVKEERSFGFWSPRRCDVYVVSYHHGYLQDRLEVVSFLWQHNISADLMYESGIPDADHESYVDICAREGVLFSVYPRPRTGRRDQLAFKVKNILKGTEYELTRQELVAWLQQQIAEQKRVDTATSSAPRFSDSLTTHLPPGKEVAASSDLQLLLPVDTKKQRKQVKQLFMDRAFETAVEIKSAVQAGMPTLAVDVLPAVFDSMIRSPAWLTDEEAWKSLATAFPAQQSAYAQQVREAAQKRRTEGHSFILLFAVREERVQLLNLT
ncbi:kinase-like domain-containing protein [Mycena sp. CBHHK59/15]|nr:kinase-like domain-containing protein [Mycena sp. CBHHK59/15]